MVKFGIATASVMASAMSVAAFAVAGAAVPAKIVAFTGTYTGTATVQVNDSQVANISATGKGTGTILGASKISGTGTGNAAVQPCVPFSGPGTLTAANGTKLVFTVAPGAQGCGDEQGDIFSISGKATVTKGTLKLAKAHGTLKLTGVYDHTAGTFSVKFTGNLTIPA